MGVSVGFKGSFFKRPVRVVQGLGFGLLATSMGLSYQAYKQGNYNLLEVWFLITSSGLVA